MHASATRTLVCERQAQDVAGHSTPPAACSDTSTMLYQHTSNADCGRHQVVQHIHKPPVLSAAASTPYRWRLNRESHSSIPDQLTGL